MFTKKKIFFLEQQITFLSSNNFFFSSDKYFFLKQQIWLVLQKVYFSRNIFFHVQHPWMCHDKSKRALVVQRKSFELEHFICEWKSLKGRIRTSTLNGIRENASEITHTSIPTAFCINAHLWIFKFDFDYFDYDFDYFWLFWTCIPTEVMHCCYQIWITPCCNYDTCAVSGY